MADAALENYVLQVVPSMVELSRIMRNVGLRLYTDTHAVQERLSRVQILDNDLKLWRQSLPIHFQPADQSLTERTLKSRNSATYVKKQSIVLHLRKF